MSDLRTVLKQLQQERSRLVIELRQLDQAIRALSAVGVKSARKVPLGRTSRAMSAAGRKRIAAAQRARWAKFRATKGKTKREAA